MKEVRRPNCDNTLFPSNNSLNFFSNFYSSTEEKQLSKLGVIIPFFLSERIYDGKK